MKIAHKFEKRNFSQTGKDFLFVDGVLSVLSKNSGVLWESGIFSDSPEIFQIPSAHFADRPFANYIWKESQVISKVFHSLQHDSWISKAAVNTIWEVPERYNFPRNILTWVSFENWKHVIWHLWKLKSYSLLCWNYSLGFEWTVKTLKRNSTPRDIFL